MKEHVWYDPIEDLIFLSRYFLEIMSERDGFKNYHGLKFYCEDTVTECIYLGEL